MAEKKSRAPKVSTEQADRLVQYMTDHPDFCLGKLLCCRGYPLQNQMCEKLAEDLNAMQGPKKDVKAWKKTWSDLEGGARQKAAAAKESFVRTGNDGTPVVVPDRDQKILSVIAGESSFGIPMVECGTTADPGDWVDPNDLVPSVQVPDNADNFLPPANIPEERASLLLDEMEEEEEERHAPRIMTVPLAKPANLANCKIMVVTANLPSSTRQSSVLSTSVTIPSVSTSIPTVSLATILSAPPAAIPSALLPATVPSPVSGIPDNPVTGTVPTPRTPASSASRPSTPSLSKRRTAEPTSSSGKRARTYTSGTSLYEKAKSIAEEGTQRLTDIARSIDKLTEAVVAQNAIAQQALEENAQTLALLSTLVNALHRLTSSFQTTYRMYFNRVILGRLHFKYF